ncbi:uncharacterized protein LOC127010973 [Drosophila biarmipes]|uniref:uncharacterized protein LOC127010973 n=1 Tax=Drosophila biarmipes TaxID=125945 RepID=UPI0021CC52EE|nr:uncharacterized protein LOC127010973 [Drosophila biarmipes]
MGECLLADDTRPRPVQSYPIQLCSPGGDIDMAMVMELRAAETSRWAGWGRDGAIKVVHWWDQQQCLLIFGFVLVLQRLEQVSSALPGGSPDRRPLRIPIRTLGSSQSLAARAVNFQQFYS